MFSFVIIALNKVYFFKNRTYSTAIFKNDEGVFIEK